MKNKILISTIILNFVFLVPNFAISAPSAHNDATRAAISTAAVWGLSERDVNFLDAAELLQKAQINTNIANIMSAANGNDKVASLLLGMAYLQGIGISQSNSDALKYLKKASDAGIARGMVQYGVMIDNGIGITRDSSFAMGLYETAGALGNPIAKFMLANNWLNGTSGTKNEAKAATYMIESAQMGYPRAYHSLGLYYMSGVGMNKNEAEAVRLFQLAINTGQTASKPFLGYLLAYGKGTNANLDLGQQYIREAAVNGDKMGMFFYGGLYRDGMIPSRNNSDAIFWFKRAAREGVGEAAEYLQTEYHIGCPPVGDRFNCPD